MSEWKIYKLGDIATFQTGKLNSNAAVSNGQYPFFTCSPITLSIDTWAFDKEAIILAGNNAEGNFSIKYYKGKFNAYQRTYIIEAMQGVCDTKFLYYSLKIFLKHFKRLSQGTSTKFLTAVILRSIEISLPPLAEQKRIADILSAIDDKIELNRRINANLEQQAQALYKSWFVDFEPFGGKIPEDWRVGVISDIVDLLNGFAFKSSDFVENGLYKLITIKGVQDGKMSLDGADCLNVIPPKMPQWCKLKKEDILLSLTGNVGRCCLVDTENCLLNQRVAKLQPKEEYNRLFIYALFRQEEMKARMISISRGTAQMNLSPKETGKLSLIIPSNEVLKDFGNRFNNIIHILTNNIVESSYLAQLRDTLLPKLMSGEIKV